MPLRVNDWSNTAKPTSPYLLTEQSPTCEWKQQFYPINAGKLSSIVSAVMDKQYWRARCQSFVVCHLTTCNQAIISGIPKLLILKFATSLIGQRGKIENTTVLLDFSPSPFHGRCLSFRQDLQIAWFIRVSFNAAYPLKHLGEGIPWNCLTNWPIVRLYQQPQTKQSPRFKWRDFPAIWFSSTK